MGKGHPSDEVGSYSAALSLRCSRRTQLRPAQYQSDSRPKPRHASLRLDERVARLCLASGPRTGWWVGDRPCPRFSSCQVQAVRSGQWQRSLSHVRCMNMCAVLHMHTRCCRVVPCRAHTCVILVHILASFCQTLSWILDVLLSSSGPHGPIHTIWPYRLCDDI